MILPFLLAGLVIIASTRKKPIRKALPASNKGIIFTCSYIEITDKTKFHENLKNDLKIYLEKQNWKVDFLAIYNEMLKKYNLSCYNKILSRKLTSKEKVSLLLFISEVSDVLHHLIWGFEYNPNTPEYKQYVANLANTEAPLIQWLDASQEYQIFEETLDSFRKNFRYPIGV